MLDDLSSFPSHVLCHLLSKFLNLFLELSEQGVLRVLVDPDIVLDVLGTVGVL